MSYFLHTRICAKGYEKVFGFFSGKKEFDIEQNGDFIGDDFSPQQKFNAFCQTLLESVQRAKERHLNYKATAIFSFKNLNSGRTIISSSNDNVHLSTEAQVTRYLKSLSQQYGFTLPDIQHQAQLFSEKKPQNIASANNTSPSRYRPCVHHPTFKDDLEAQIADSLPFKIKITSTTSQQEKWGPFYSRAKKSDSSAIKISNVKACLDYLSEQEKEWQKKYAQAFSERGLDLAIEIDAINATPITKTQKIVTTEDINMLFSEAKEALSFSNECKALP